MNGSGSGRTLPRRRGVSWARLHAMPTTVAESVSPNGNAVAYVEQDERVAHFFIRIDPGVGPADIRSCWVRNFGVAPERLDVAGMREGIAPMLPRPSCREPGGSPPLDPERLRIVWFEDGVAAALLEDGEPLAILPLWSGFKGFGGYARDCAEETPLCWPLIPENALLPRVRAAETYWSDWDSPTSPWTVVQNEQLRAYDRQLGTYDKYYAIDGGAWPPKALVRTPVPGGFALTTIGVCLRPQPGAELAGDEGEPFRRIELGIGVTDEMMGHYDSAANFVSGQTNLPWNRVTWLAHHHTVPCDAFAGTGFTAVLLTNEPRFAPEVLLPPLRGDRVALLWLLPITERERSFAVKYGSALLAERLATAGVSYLFRRRSSVG